ncbi:MAG: 4-hydroxy-tetrahydrodipicolinate reductase [Pseudomonadota bacterium]
MHEPMKLVVAGVSGRMGRMLVEVISDSSDVILSGATERAGHSWIGQDLGLMLGTAASGVIVASDISVALDGADGLIDFTAPAATLAFSKAASDAQVVHVIGTTGMSNEELALLHEQATGATVVRAGNMSLGVNLLVQLTKKVAAALDDDYDIEVIEAHHNHKVDAPSGTALMLGSAAAEGRNVELSDVADRARDGIAGARTRGSIGFSAIRGGDIVGEHDVMFAALGERIILRHVASDRAVFARGAVKAALWARDRGAGEYDMLDVLGLKDA